ncbi:MAG TPA: UDP-N-acetylglucosamine 2-epimerase [Gaiellaceae bacterium]|nr:UDP-N-acetylglucosamine 2-epimerase [Gaiellaceae bacterium]
MRKVCVVVGSRANYSSIKSAMRAIADHSELELQLVVGASALLDRYGSVEHLIERDGFEADQRVFMLIEGETPSTMAKSTGLGLLELPTAFERLEPDVVITVGDRFETMATALAATYMNIPLAHTMGGEVSGNIDESIRHAVTKFAHVHFPASEGAAERIVKLGEDPECVHVVGCPRMDLVADVLANDGNGLSELFETGVGGRFSLDEPFLLVSQHPVTTEYGDGKRQIQETLKAVQEVAIPAIVLWPNADAGSEHIAAGMRQWREHNDDSKLHFFKNLPTDDYVKLMAKTAALVGNSSSAIREGAFIGTPAVNIGPRQEGRDRGSNVVDTDYDKAEIAAAIRGQVEHGRYESEPIYGDGHAGERIADVLATKPLSIHKRITY